MQKAMDLHPVESPAKVVGVPAFPLKHSANKRYLVDQDNVPFLIHGDTMWMWQIHGSFTTQEDIETYLDDRAIKGFTAIQFQGAFKIETDQVMEDVNGNRPFEEEIIPGSGLWKLDTPNQSYFDHLRWLVAACAERGLLANMTALWLGYKSKRGFYEDLHDPYNSDSICFAYGQYLGRQFGEFNNIIWIHGGDRVPNALEISRSHKIMEGIRSSSHTALHTAHWRRPPDTNFAREVKEFQDVDVEIIYSASLTYCGCLRNWSNELSLRVIPAFMVESLYEGNLHYPAASPWPAAMCRRQAIWSILSGAGHIYSHQKPSFPGSLNSPGAQQMAYVKRLFSTLAWYKLVPDIDHTVVIGGRGTREIDQSRIPQVSNDYVTAARSADGSLVVAYLPPIGKGTRTLTVNMASLGGASICRWFNPTNGTYTSIAGKFQPRGLKDFTSPGDNGTGQNDWVFVLQVSLSDRKCKLPTCPKEGG